jgi:small-conductance mechanosensitive channel
VTLRWRSPWGLRRAAAAPVLALQVSGAGDGGSGLLVVPGLTPELQSNLIVSVIVVLALFFVRRGIMAVVGRRLGSQALRYRWGKSTGYAAFVIGVLVLVQVWFTAIQSLGTFLGLLSAGLAIALKDLVADLAGWFFILWRRPFDLGDRVEVGGFAGDVVDRRIFQFTIMEIGNWVDADQSTGRLIHIPNATLFTQPLANYVAGFPYLWNELKVVVTFESDWRKAKGLLDEVAEEFTIDLTKEAHEPRKRDEERFLIHYRKLTPVVYVSVVDHGVLLTLRYLCRPRERRGTAGDLWERILDAFSEAPDVVLAYPTQRINMDKEVRAQAVDGDPAPAPPDAPEQ